MLTVELPPLRTYKDNLPILAQVFLQQAAQRHGRRVSTLGKDAMGSVPPPIDVVPGSSGVPIKDVKVVLNKTRRDKK